MSENPGYIRGRCLFAGLRVSQLDLRSMLDVAEAAAVEQYGLKVVRAWLDPDVIPELPVAGRLAPDPALDPDTWGTTPDAVAGQAAFNEMMPAGAP